MEDLQKLMEKSIKDLEKLKNELSKMKKATEEVFKDIPGYEGVYQISDLGRVKSLKLNRERILKPIVSGNGYLFVNLFCEGKQKNITVHQLVAIVFLNHTPCGHKIVVDHINCDEQDNRLSNLQLISNRENLSKDKKGYTSKYTGVCWKKQNKKWISQIIINGKAKYLGLFTDEYDAHLAYQRKLKEIINK